MATTKHKAWSAAAQTALSTDLNSLANSTNSAASAEIDNSTALDLYVDAVLYVAAQGSARSAGGTVTVYMISATDGTNYDDAHETTAEIVAVFPLDAATTARRLTRRDIPIPPGKFKLFLRNGTGQAFASSGSTLTYRAHSIETA